MPTDTNEVAQSKHEPGVIADGTWAVGADVQPGTYRAAGGSLCYWETLKSPHGSDDAFDNIIANGAGDANPVVELKSGQWFETNDCGDWQLVAADVPAAPAASTETTADSSDWRECGTTPNGLGIIANALTSCEFARRVGDAADKSGGREVLSVYSPVTGKSYDMRRTSENRLSIAGAWAQP